MCAMLDAGLSVPWLPDQWFTVHSLVTVVAALTYVVTSRVMRQRRHPAAAVAWMLFIVLMPYIALPAYLSFGTRKVARPRPSQAALPWLPAPAGSPPAWAPNLLAALRQAPPVPCHDLAVHADGSAARASLLATIDGATRTLDVCTFILSPDALGLEVTDRLCQRARAGVRVRVLVDGLGPIMGGRPPFERLRAAGARTLLFVPPLRSTLRGRSNLRNHRKLVVADGGWPEGRLWSGGRNLAAHYFDGGPGIPPWTDLSFDLRGPLVEQAAHLFDADWVFAGGALAWPRALQALEKTGARLALPHAPPPPGTDAAPARQVPQATAPRVPIGDDATEADRPQVQLVASGPDQVDDTLYELLVASAYRAEAHIRIATPYFVPEPALLMALCLAARRGVRVELLLPARSNHRISDLARSRSLRTLADAGAHVLLTPRMLHAKLVVIDESLALAGSTNLDGRSLFLNYEMMVAFHAPGAVRAFAEWHAREAAGARPHVPRAPSLARDLAEGMLLALAFQL